MGVFPEGKRIAYLLNGHHDLHGVQAVKPEVVGEVGDAGDLIDMGVSVCECSEDLGSTRGDADGNRWVDGASSKLTLLASETWRTHKNQ